MPFEMRIRSSWLAVATVQVMSLVVTAACSSVNGPTGDLGSSSQLATALRAKSISVSTLGQTSAGTNGYLSVGSKDLKVGNGDDLMKVFEYSSSSQADADARMIDSEGQFGPRLHIGWISAPNFYKHGQIIVLYLGCSDEIVQVLNDLLGPAIARGPGCPNP